MKHRDWLRAFSRAVFGLVVARGAPKNNESGQREDTLWRARTSNRRGPGGVRPLLLSMMSVAAVILSIGACGPSSAPGPAENIGSTASALYSDLKIWDNALQSNFTDGRYGMSSWNTCDTSRFTTSTCSYQATFAANQWGAYQFILSAGFSTQSYSYLEFTMHLNGQPLSDFEVRLAKWSDNSEIPVPPHTLTTSDVVATYANGFQRFRIPVTAINPNNDTIKKVIIKSTQSTALSPVWLDELLFWGDPGCNASADTSQLNFECGSTQGMSSTSGVTSIDWSTAKSYAGSYSLEARFDGTVARPEIELLASNGTLPSGSFTITAHVFVPTDSPITRAQVFAQDVNFNWFGTFQTITPGAWSTLTYDVDATASLNAIGVEFDVPTAGWTGNAYVDSIGWVASGTRSVLYPSNWTPGFKVQSTYYVQDYSYAGYQYGLEPPTSADDSGKYFQDVVSGDGRSQIQTKIDNIVAYLDAHPSVPGGVLRFPAGTFTINLDATNRLTIPHSNIVLRGAGYGSTYLRISDASDTNDNNSWAGIKFGGNAGTSSEDLLTADASEFATYVLVPSTSLLAAGDDVAIGWKITNDFRAEHNVPSNYWCNGVACDSGVNHGYDWVTFFRRKVVSVTVEGTNRRVTLDVPLRYAVKTRDSASVKRVTGLISECGLEDLSISDTAPGTDDGTSWTKAHASDKRTAVEFSGTKDCWMRNVHSYQTRSYPSGLPESGSAAHLRSGGVHLVNAKRMTIRNCDLESPQNRTSNGNGYLYHLEGANEVLVRGSSALHGRHGFVLNWAFGHSGNVFLDSRTAYSEENDGTGSSPQYSASTSEFHHGLAMANLIDSSTIDDWWSAVNRGTFSSNASMTSTQNVFWNCNGGGKIESKQWGQGYIIGAASSLTLDNAVPGTRTCGGGILCGTNTGPADYIEATGVTDLSPSSLYCDQLAKRSLSCPP